VSNFEVDQPREKRDECRREVVTLNAKRRDVAPEQTRERLLDLFGGVVGMPVANAPRMTSRAERDARAPSATRSPGVMRRRRSRIISATWGAVSSARRASRIRRQGATGHGRGRRGHLCWGPMGAELQPLLEGTPYRVRRVLARGGMALVLDAEHASGQAVVVKVLRPDLRDDGDLPERMAAEAELLRGLRHPNVVAVLDFGLTAQGRPYLVMERLEGKTLADELKARGALPVPLALAVARQALAGLEASHAQAVIHRDVKPGNLFVCGGLDGACHVKLLDFGIAKLTPRSRLAGMAPKTAPGEVLGTPWFMAPEQLLGRAVTPATDVYAMGMVIWQMLVGRHPFAEHRNAQAVWQAQLTMMPAPPSRVAGPAVGAALDSAVLRAIAKAPADRFPSAASLAAALTTPQMPDSRGAATLVGAAPVPSPLPPQRLLVPVAPRQSRLPYALVAGAGIFWHALGVLGMLAAFVDPTSTSEDEPTLVRLLAAGELVRHTPLLGAACALMFLLATPEAARRWLRAWLTATAIVTGLALAIGLVLAPFHAGFMTRRAPFLEPAAPFICGGMPIIAACMQLAVLLIVRRWRP
jgi:eukaryotic-like serine/threonine-protein kinase